MTQAAKTNDINTCRRCKAPCQVTIYEGQKNSTFQCSHCLLVQKWIPSKNYKLAVA